MAASANTVDSLVFKDFTLTKEIGCDRVEYFQVASFSCQDQWAGRVVEELDCCHGIQRMAVLQIVVSLTVQTIS